MAQSETAMAVHGKNAPVEDVSRKIEFEFPEEIRDKIFDRFSEIRPARCAVMPAQL